MQPVGRRVADQQELRFNRGVTKVVMGEGATQSHIRPFCPQQAAGSTKMHMTLMSTGKHHTHDLPAMMQHASQPAQQSK
jgi:hypothetical protein